jgi:serine O-acetyltransferase
MSVGTANPEALTAPTASPPVVVDERPADAPPAAHGSTNQNPAGVGLWALLREDLRTHDGLWLEQGFWAVAVHRLGNWRMGLPKLLRMPMTVVYRLLYKVVEWTCGISLPYTVKLGRRVRLWHHGGMILHAHAIGDDCQLRHNTTLGVARTGENYRLPTLGAGCDIGAGAAILGEVQLGDGAVVGANGVVTKDVPAGGVAVGIPARVVKVVGSDDAGRAKPQAALEAS